MISRRHSYETDADNRKPSERRYGKIRLYLLLDRLKGGHSGIVRMELEGQTYDPQQL